MRSQQSIEQQIAADTRRHGTKPATCAVACALLILSLTAGAACDPHGIKPVPCPAPSGSHGPLNSTYQGSHPSGYSHPASKPHTYTAAKKPVIGPKSPGPLHSNATHTQSIRSTRSRDKAALNPQPIPPGRGSPPKWDVSKNKGS